MADDHNTLKSLLLIAIQDDPFESVRDIIAEKPQRKIYELMNNIHEKDLSIQPKDGSREL